jgi:hypothetical protein
MIVFVCRDQKTVKEIDQVIDIHISFSGQLVVTWFNFETRAFSEVFEADKWDSFICNKKVLKKEGRK